MNPSASSPIPSDFDDRECFLLAVSVRRGSRLPAPADVGFLLATMGAGLLAGHEDDLSDDLRVDVLPAGGELGNVEPWRMAGLLKDLRDDEWIVARELVRELEEGQR